MGSIVAFIGSLITFAVIIAALLGLIAAWGYNTLRKLVEEVKEAQSNIDVALRKKVSLVNQLADVASKYMDRESLVMLKVSQDSTAATPQLYQQTGTVLSTIQGLAQKFPQLQASEQYSRLATEIANSESDVQKYRVQCNAAVKNYNSMRSGLPHVLYAGFLGFQPARYLELDSVESPDASVQKSIISDDGDRLNELLGMAGTRMISATKTLTSQSILLAEKAASRVQTEIAARQGGTLAAAVEYTYLDATRTPKGPLSRGELDGLFRAGDITADTDILEVGARTWVKYSTLPPAPSA